MDFVPTLVYTISVGGGAIIGTCINVLTAYKVRGAEYMMRMPDKQHIPMALAGAAAGALFAQATMTPPSDVRHDTQPRGIEYQEPRPTPDVVADNTAVYTSLRR